MTGLRMRGEQRIQLPNNASHHGLLYTLLFGYDAGMQKTDIIFIYIPCRDFAEADAIGAAVVEARLAACANILPQMKSIYRWQGNIEKAEEVVLILKTTFANFKTVEERVRALHSYETPCIAAFNLEKVNQSYLHWLLDEVKE